MILTTEQQKKLRDAEILIAQVQIELLKADEHKPLPDRDGWWRTLYGIRINLAGFMHARGGCEGIY